jgi:hypothetical protein
VDNSKKHQFPDKPAIASQSRVFCLKRIPRRTPGERKVKKMNKNYKRVLTRFGPETRFEVKPAPPAPFRGTQETELERLKKRLLRELLYDVGAPGLNGYLRRAVNEAAALAWVTPYPLLMFPGLLDEKVEAALLQAARQENIRQRSLELLNV